MMHSRGVCRSLAESLLQLVMRLSPPERRVWARAMAAEQMCLESDVEALRWAAGCLCASLRTLLRDGALLDHRRVRWAIALWAGYQAEDSLCTALVPLACKRHTDAWAVLLARWCAGGDFRPLYPVIDAIRAWEIGLVLVAAALYLMAALLLLGRRRRAARVFPFALAICCGLWLYELAKPVYFDAFPLSEHLRAAALYGLTGLVAWVVWVGTRGGLTVGVE